jgi:predicted metal-dependent phosphoesterase TrpH
VEIVKCDLHVHSYYSGPCTTPILAKFCRESYSDPQAVMAQLRRRGMGLFTLTDHDSIEGSEQLRRDPNFFLSEELTCRMPSGTEVHIGVYDFHERQHAQLQQRRNDLIALLMYLTERKLFFSINHVFSGLTGRRDIEDFAWFQEYFPAVEVRNSHMLASANRDAALLARRWQKIGIGGSDAHALPSVGMAYTEVSGARDKEEFFSGLRAGFGRAAGESGSTIKLARDILAIGLEMMRENRWTTLLVPLAALIPAAAFLNYRWEKAFGHHWARQVLYQSKPRRRARWVTMPQPAAEEWA